MIYGMDNPYPFETGDEVRNDHFEYLRRMIWIRQHLGSGRVFNDYTTANEGALSHTGSGSTTSWSDYVAAMEFSEFPVKPSDGAVTNIIFIDSGETEGDLYSLRETIESRSKLLATPPIAGGVLNSTYWARVPDVNFYHDFDHNSGRKWIVRTKKGSGATLVEHVLDVDAFRELPRQVDPQCQRPRIHYDDTERNIPHIQSVEFFKKVLSQPPTMGARYELDILHIDDSTHRRTKFSDGKELGSGGLQYAHDSGEPGNKPGSATGADPPYQKEDNQFYYDIKMCHAYQNMVERLCNRGAWVWPIDPETVEGAGFINHYNADILAPFVNDPEISAWVSGGGYDDLDKVWYNGRVWYCDYGFDGSGTPGDSYDWILVTELYGDALDYPTSASLTHRYWGCNESGLEFCLKVLDKFDWYYDTAYPWTPYPIQLIRHQLADDVGDPQADVDAAYPPPHGTWRRTWKHSFGRVSLSMRPYESGAPAGQTYWDYQTDSGATAHTDMHWPGIYRYDEPNLTLGASSEALLAARHDPVAEDSHEIAAEALQTLYDVIDMLRYNAAGSTIQLQNRNAQGNVSTTDRITDLRVAYETAVARSVDSIPSAAWTTPTIADATYWGVFQEYPSGGGYYWTGAMRVDETAFLLGGGWANGRYLARDIRIKIQYTEDVLNVTDGYDVLTTPEFRLGWPDGTMQTYQSRLYSGSPQQVLIDLTIPPDRADDDWEGDDEHRIGINFIDGAPRPDVRIADNNSDVAACYSRINFKLADSTEFEDGIYFELDFDNVPPAVWDTVRHRDFTHIAVDDGKFNNQGILI